jgi:hypothetical protein
MSLYFLSREVDMMTQTSKRNRPLFFFKALTISVLFIASVQFLAWFVANHPDSQWRIAAAAAPIVAIAVALVGSMSSVRGMDERDVRMHLEALAFAFLATFLYMSAYAFLVFANVLVLQLAMVIPMMVLFWVAGLAIALWRFR